ALGRRAVVSVAVDREVYVHADRLALLLGQVTQQASRPGEQREPAQQVDGEAEVGQGRAAGARAVERQGAAEDLRVDPADRLEQLQVRAAQSLLLGDPDQHRGPRVGDLVHRVAQAGDEQATRTGLPYRRQRYRIPARVVIRQRLTGRRQRGGQETAAVLGDAEEPGTPAQQARRQG